jgi:hypothetical protein
MCLSVADTTDTEAFSHVLPSTTSNIQPNAWCMETTTVVRVVGKCSRLLVNTYSIMHKLYCLLLLFYTTVLLYTCRNVIVITEALQPLSTFRHRSNHRCDTVIPTPSLLLVQPRRRDKFSVLFVRRYGPIDNDSDLLDGGDEAIPTSSTSSTDTNDKFNHERIALRKVVDSVLSVKDPQHIPSILTKNIELILTCMTTEDGALLVEAVIEDILMDQPDAGTATTVLEAIDIIMSFGEEFVQYTSQIEKQNQLLLGKIIKIIATSSPTTDNDKERRATAATGGPSREEELDLLLEKERPQFTPGFLRHIENECQRIASAPSMTVESTRLLETLRIIQTRVLEEVCSQDLGEAAQVLGQIIGYDTKMERIAVLDAGLMVRGVSFAEELLALTTEALIGFQNVMNGADPDLVIRVQQIHDRLQVYIAQNDPNATGIGSVNTIQEEDSFA